MAETETTRQTLNKAKLADAVADDTGLARSVAYEVVERVFDIMAKTVASGGSVSISNFGSMERIDKGPRAARNPQTGARIQLPPRKAVKWTVSPRLQQFANSDDPSQTTIRKMAKTGSRS